MKAIIVSARTFKEAEKLCKRMQEVTKDEEWDLEDTVVMLLKCFDILYDASETFTELWEETNG